MSVRGTTEHVCVSWDIRQIVCPVTILLHAVSEQNKSQDYPLKNHHFVIIIWINVGIWATNLPPPPLTQQQSTDYKLGLILC